MKRVMSFILILTMCLSLTSCAQIPIEGEEETIENMVIIVPEGWESRTTDRDNLYNIYYYKKTITIEYYKGLSGTLTDEYWQDDFIDGYRLLSDDYIEDAKCSKYSTTIADQEAFGFDAKFSVFSSTYTLFNVVIVEHENIFYCITYDEGSGEKQLGIDRNGEFTNFLKSITFKDADELNPSEETEDNSTFDISAEELIDTLSKETTGEITRTAYTILDGYKNYNFKLNIDDSKFTIFIKEIQTEKIDRRIEKIAFYGDYDSNYRSIVIEIFKALGARLCLHEIYVIMRTRRI